MTHALASLVALVVAIVSLSVIYDGVSKALTVLNVSNVSKEGTN